MGRRSKRWGGDSWRRDARGGMRVEERRDAGTLWAEVLNLFMVAHSGYRRSVLPWRPGQRFGGAIDHQGCVSGG